MLETIEERFIVVGILTLFLLAGPYLYSRHKWPKRQRKRQDWLYILAVLMMLFVLFMQFSSFRPYHPISIIVTTCTIILVLGFCLIFFFRPLQNVGILDKRGKIKKLNVFVVVLSYIWIFSFLWQGLDFLLASVFNPESMVLTPEFRRYLIPTMAGVLLIFYRINRRTNFLLLKSIDKFSETIIFASFASFVYVVAAGFLGVELSQSFAPQGIDFFIGGAMVGAAGIILEIFIYHASRSLQQQAAHLKGKSVFDLISLEGLLLMREKEKHEIFKKTREREPKKHVKKNFITRHSKPITVVLLAACIILFYLLIPIRVKILITAFSVSTEIVDENNLPSGIEILMSDQLEGKNLTSFAVPLVNISAGDYSYTAPNSARYSAISSSGFEVTEQHEYLVVRLTQTSVETTASVNRFSRVDYDQRGNSQFNYVGLPRDAEIYYALHVFGYDNITTFSSSGGLEISSASKVVYATALDNNQALVETFRMVDMFPIEDRIVITTLHSELSENMKFLLEQMKLNITIESKIDEPEPSFRFV